MNDVKPELVSTNPDNSFAEAGIFVDSLDRSVFKDFANNREMLIFGVVVINDFLQRPLIDRDFIDEADERLAQLQEESGYINAGKIQAEVIFWKAYTGEEKLEELRAAVDGLQGVIAVWLERYDKLMKHPDMYSYFVANLWDVKANKRFAAAGIDATLALDVWKNDAKI